jgi:hypothetical protein
MAIDTQISAELRRIMDLAATRIPEAVAGMHAHHGGEDAAGEADQPGCSVRRLPDRLATDAAGVATAVNPVNAPQGLAQIAGLPDAPSFLTIAIGKYFGPAARTLSVSFLEATPADLRARIIQHLNAWADCCGISFAYTQGIGEVRISRTGAGYWSYLGTDILLIPPDRPTMNLQAFTMATPETEYRRVVRHEAGHTLGFPHEHMRGELVARIDPEKAYAYFWRDQGWNRQQVDQQVLTPLDAATILGTPADQNSIMCYQLPGNITRDGLPIIGGTDINATDCAFAKRVYPKPAGLAGLGSQVAEDAQGGYDAAPVADALEARTDGPETIAEDWDEAEDVHPASAIEEFRARSATAD